MHFQPRSHSGRTSPRFGRLNRRFHRGLPAPRRNAHVHAVDVGSGQLSANLRKQTLSVHNLEQLHLKDMTAEHIWFRRPNTVVIDLSFISLSHVWPRLAAVGGTPNGWGVALVKPQFEVGPKHLGRNGIVRDDKVRAQSASNAVWH